MAFPRRDSDQRSGEIEDGDSFIVGSAELKLELSDRIESRGDTAHG